ncbi:CPBP family intramembrane glutamic endopeptidase [Micromonospora sp. 067-2]|uniref:CPBP family intramembrane glutamic endopeptidase n=1 Tax=Micromonospora sp. 067-2 TaxID=2789270 RepID=UPI003978B5EF
MRGDGLRVGGLRARIADRPVLWFWLIAVAIELVVIPVFLLSGAQEGVDAALTATGTDFNTDLVTAFRLVLNDHRAMAGVVLSLIQVAAPDIAVLMVGLLAGRHHLRQVARRWRFWSPATGWRRGLRIWLQMVAVFCAMNLATAGLNAMTARDEGFVWNVRPLLWPLLIGLVIAMFLDGGAVFEENGWRGFALPLLQTRYGPLLGSIVLGLMWTAWHLPVKFDLVGYGPGALSIVAVLTAKFVALTVLMTWFFNRIGGATILAVAMHGLSNDSVRLGGFVFGDSLSAYLISEINLLVPLAIGAVAVTLASRGRLGLPSTVTPTPSATVRRTPGRRHASTLRGKQVDRSDV